VANNLAILDGTGAAKTARTEDIGGDIHAQLQKVAPWMPTVVSGAQYNQTVTSSVFMQTVPSGATHCLISVRNDAVHYTEDGSSPSATAGIYLPAGFIGELAIPAALKFHRVTTDAVIAITYRKYV
jgi:hypothetical protein